MRAPLLLGWALLVGCGPKAPNDADPGDSATAPEPDTDTDTGDSGETSVPRPTLSGVCSEEGLVSDLASVTLYGAPGDEFGATLAGLGDIDGDGLGDLLIGSSGNDEAANGAGAAFLVRGGTHLVDGYFPPSVDHLFGDDAGDGFGFAVAGAGDIDGDGFSDALIGAFLDDEGGTDAGAAYLMFGHPDGLLARAPVKVLGEAANDATGRATGVGDVDGDGLGDILVAADNSGMEAGSIHLVLGSALTSATGPISLPADARASFRGEAPGDDLTRVDGGADLDGDGLDDMALGAQRWKGDGAVYLVAGSPTLSGEIDVGSGGWEARLEGSTGALAGHAMATPGDVNGDGRDDLLISAPYESGVGYKKGAVFVITSMHSGVHALLDIAEVRVDGASNEDRMGYDISGGDIDFDGIADFQLGAKFEETRGNHAGTIYLIPGPLAPGVHSPADASLQYAAIRAEEAGDNLGVVAYLGDADGNGFADVAAGARFGGASDQGAAYLLRCGL